MSEQDGALPPQRVRHRIEAEMHKSPARLSQAENIAETEQQPQQLKMFEV